MAKTKDIFDITLEDADEWCNEALLEETYGDENEARTRFEGIKGEMANGEWRDGLALWLFKNGLSIDGYEN